MCVINRTIWFGLLPGKGSQWDTLDIDDTEFERMGLSDLLIEEPHNGWSDSYSNEIYIPCKLREGVTKEDVMAKHNTYWDIMPDEGRPCQNS